MIEQARFVAQGRLRHGTQSYDSPMLKVDDEYLYLSDVFKKMVPKGYTGYVEMEIYITPTDVPETDLIPLKLPSIAPEEDEPEVD